MKCLVIGLNHLILLGFPVFIPFSQHLLVIPLPPEILLFFLPAWKLTRKQHANLLLFGMHFNDNYTKQTSFNRFELAQLFSNWMVIKTVVGITTVFTCNLPLIHFGAMHLHWIFKFKPYLYRVTHAALCFVNCACEQYNRHTFRRHPHEVSISNNNLKHWHSHSEPVAPLRITKNKMNDIVHEVKQNPFQYRMKEIPIYHKCKRNCHPVI